ncbi:MAG TPA: F0F1 ATP synthase subunit A [Vicinamibacteria bacterium]|nr:F0F1 ATP synthase subunit A [Vicinamibacteria bacterium]
MHSRTKLGANRRSIVGILVRRLLVKGRTRRLAVAALLAGLCWGLGMVRPSAAEPAPQGSAPAAEAAGSPSLAKPDGEANAIPEQEEHGLPRSAVELARPLGFPITNSMAVSWVVALGLIVFAHRATRSMKQVPDGAQNVLEWLVSGLYGLLEGIIGRHLVQRTFWFFATIFIFIITANWVGLIPGVGTIGWGHQSATGFKIDQPLLRGANADLNLTLAMAIVFFALWIYWALREVGLRGMAHELFGAKGDTAGFMKVLMVIVFFAAGCLEVVSILFRPVSLSFRLYGNIFAGENMLETMARLVPGLGWLLPIPFYFLELLVGLVQALVFMLLTAVFTLLICQHEEEAPVTAHDE